MTQDRTGSSHTNTEPLISKVHKVKRHRGVWHGKGGVDTVHPCAARLPSQGRATLSGAALACPDAGGWAL